MAKYRDYEERTEKLLKPVTDSFGFEIVDVEYVKEGSNFILRAYIDKPGGITIDDCEAVSRKLSDLLDENDYIEDSYVMEVSSPGLGRQLKKDRDFARSIGKEVEVKLFKALEKQKEFTGILKEYNDESVSLDIAEKLVVLSRSNIAMIRLTIQL